MEINNLMKKLKLLEQTTDDATSVAADRSATVEPLSTQQTSDLQALSRMLPGVNPTLLLTALKMPRPTAQANAQLATAFKALVHLDATNMAKITAVLRRLSRRVQP